MRLSIEQIPDVKVFAQRLFRDDRGVFSETYNKKSFDALTGGIDFIQDNRSLSVKQFTVRGLHFQTPPFAQSKLVFVQKGRVLDVAIDLRRSSPTFGHHVAVELTADGGEQIFVPVGFAHGFCTLEPDTIVTYKVDNYYAPGHEGGLHWRTPELEIAWPCAAEEGSLSPKDLVLPDRVEASFCFD
jgi:dTDP-4-dehydrorhamnose 3,5-epimerase